MASIGLRIIDLIKEKGMTQKEFSEKTGIPQSTISDWRGKRLNPKVDKILKICDTLNISVQDLLSGEKQSENTNVEYMCIDKGSPEYEIILEYRKLQSKDKMRLEGYLRALLEKR